jgi:hypothetical protein
MLREEPSSSTGRAAASKQVAAARTKRMSSAVAAAVRRLWKPLIAVVSGGRTEKREWNGWEGKEKEKEKEKEEQRVELLAGSAVQRGKHPSCCRILYTRTRPGLSEATGEREHSVLLCRSDVTREREMVRGEKWMLRCG